MSGVELYGFNSGGREAPISGLMQFHQGGTHQTAYPYYLVDHPEGTLLFDTGVSRELIEHPREYGRHGAAELEEFTETVTAPTEQQPAEQLAAMGVSPGDVDFVVQSHLHLDHAGNIGTFPEATFLIQKRELRYAWWADGIQQGFYLDGDLHHLQSPKFTVNALTGRFDVFGDGSVVCIPTPGHSPGHQSLKLKLGDGATVILGGDIAHLQEGYEDGLFAPFYWDLEQSVNSLNTIKALEDRYDATVFLSHDPSHIERFPTPPESL